jgi:spore coat protein A, manganese oxidase
VLKFDNPWVKVTLVGNDGGLLPTAKTIISGDGVNHPDQFLVMGPADREDIVVDLSDPHLLGQKVTLLNEGPAYDPFQGIAPDGIREARPWTQLSNPSWQAAWPPFVIRLHQILLVHPC